MKSPRVCSLRCVTVSFVSVVASMMPMACGDSGSSTLDAGNACVEDPAFCQSANAVCGSVKRADGTCVACGRCQLPAICGGAGVANQCGCTPRDCATEGLSCGEFDDGCGNRLSCGTCLADQLCLSGVCAQYIPIGQNCTVGVAGCVQGSNCCLVGSGAVCVEVDTPGSCPGELPDLITRDASTRGSMELVRLNFDPTDCAVERACVGGTGERRVLRFGVFIENVGRRGAILGVPNEGSDFSARTCASIQYYDWSSFLAFSLHPENLDGSIGPAVVENVRASHCLEDGKALAPESPPSGGFSCATGSTRQGLTQGWGYTYETDIDCNWVDVTDVAAGNYVLRVVIDPLDRIEEEREDNNIRFYPVTIQ